jgi:aryl-alcohol dehydrogenase-like predicted oxidoreductase
MELRLLGSSGCSVSRLTLGTMTFGRESSEEVAHQQLDTFVEAGGNLLDTADVYSTGVSEEIVGRWLAARKGTVADGIVLATKGRFPMGAAPNDVGLSRRHLQRALDASLTRLGVDVIDLYQVHAWDPLTPIAETLRTLDSFVKAGKIRYIGLSNFTGWQVQKAVATAAALGLEAPVTLQPQYNLLVRELEWEIVPSCLDAGLGLLPWSPLGGGWLSGKYRREERPTGATRLQPPLSPGTHVGRPRGRPDGGRESWVLHGTGRPGLAGGPAGRHLGHPRSPHRRTADRQPGRG